MNINRRELRQKLGSRTARRLGTKTSRPGTKRTTLPRILLAALVREEMAKVK